MRFDISNNLPLLTGSGAAASVSNNDPMVFPSGSTGFDTLGNMAINAILTSGTLADADATFAVTISESDTTNGSYDAVGAGALSAALSTMNYTFAEDNVAKQISVKPSKRFVRITVTPSANSGAAPFSIAVQGVKNLVGTV
jgi:hypothetical protein